MRAIVCGAGIAGLTLGWWLGRDGWDVVTVERAPGLRDEGYMIDFFGAGFDVAERMGLLPRLDAVRYHVPEVTWIDPSLRKVAGLDYERMRRMLGGRLMSLMRGDLERALFDDRPAASNIRFGTSIEAIHAVEPKVDVSLTNGERLEADLLVGADGVHSTVRRHVFGDDHEFRYLGFQTAAFVFEDAEARMQLGNAVKLLSVPSRQAGFYPIRGNRIASFFVHKAPDPALPASPLEELNRVYGDLGWLVPVSLARAAELPDIYYDQVAQIVLPRWSRGCATLIGDAAYAVSLLAGQGASMAMAGAFALRQALHDAGAVPAALERYETEQRPVVEAKQASGRRMANWFVPDSRWRLFVRNAALNLTRVPGFDKFLYRSLTAA